MEKTKFKELREERGIKTAQDFAKRISEEVALIEGLDSGKITELSLGQIKEFSEVLRMPFERFLEITKINVKGALNNPTPFELRMFKILAYSGFACYKSFLSYIKIEAKDFRQFPNFTGKKKEKLVKKMCEYLQIKETELLGMIDEVGLTDKQIEETSSLGIIREAMGTNLISGDIEIHDKLNEFLSNKIQVNKEKVVKLKVYTKIITNEKRAEGLWLNENEAMNDTLIKGEIQELEVEASLHQGELQFWYLEGELVPNDADFFRIVEINDRERNKERFEIIRKQLV